MKIILSNYTGDRGNWGCQATSRHLLAYLRKAFADIPGLSIETSPFPKSHRIDDYTEAVHGDRLRSIYGHDSPTGDDLHFLDRLTRERFGSVYQKAKEADVLIFQGEGAIGPSRYFRSPRVFGLPFLASHLWKKPVLSVNQTLYAATKADEQILKSIFQKFQIVAVREMMSYHFGKRIGLSHTILCPDLAFEALYANSMSGPEAPTDKYFCVAGSAAARAMSPHQFACLVQALSEQHALKPVFLFSRGVDERFFNEVCSETERWSATRVSSKDWPDYRSLLPLLKGASFLLGGRFHTSVMALSQGTPVILLPGNTFKSEGIGPMLGLDLPVFVVEEQDAILEYAGKLMNDMNQAKYSISESVQKAKTSYVEMTRLLRQWAHPTHWHTFPMPEPGSPLDPMPTGPMPAIRHAAIYQEKNQTMVPGNDFLTRWKMALWRRTKSYSRSIESSLVDLK